MRHHKIAIILLSTIKAPSLLLSPVIRGTELIRLCLIRFRGSSGRNGNFLSTSTRGPNAMGYSIIIYYRNLIWIQKKSKANKAVGACCHHIIVIKKTVPQFSSGIRQFLSLVLFVNTLPSHLSLNVDNWNVVPVF